MVKKYLLFFIILALLSASVHAQGNSVPKPTSLNAQARSDAWLSYTTKVFNGIIERGIYAAFDSVLVVSQAGLKLAPKNDIKARAEYTYFIGHTYKVQLKYDSAFYYLKNSIAFSRQAGHFYYETLAIQQINYLYRHLGKGEETQSYISRLQELFPRSNNDEVKDRILSALSEHYLSIGYYNKAISYILTSLPLKEKILTQRKDYASKVSIGLAYFSLGNLYLQLDQHTNALSYFNLSRPYFTKYTGARVRLYTSLQQVYLNLGKLDSGMAYYKRVYQEMEDHNVYFSSADLSNVNRILASYYLQRNLVLGKKFADLAYNLALKSENKETMTLALNLMGNLSYQLNDYNKAIFYLEKALPNCFSFSKDVHAAICLKLAESYEKVGDYKKSIQYYKTYNDLFKEISKQKSDEEISKVEFKYKTIQKQKQIDNLSQEAIVATRLLKQQRQLQVVLIIVIALFLLIAVLIFMNYRDKAKANLLLQKANDDLDVVNKKLFDANQTKAQLFSIISHDLRRPVSQLFSFLKLQQSKSNIMALEEKEKHEKSLMRSSITLLDTLEDLLLWSKSQMDSFKISHEEIVVKELLESVVDFMQAQADAKDMKLVIAPLQYETINGDPNVLLAVLRNLLQNAINYSFQGTTIFIRTAINGIQQRSISVCNNGPVIVAEKLTSLNGTISLKSQSSGYGLVLIKDLVERLNAKLTIASDTAEGTEVTIVFQS